MALIANELRKMRVKAVLEERLVILQLLGRKLGHLISNREIPELLIELWRTGIALEWLAASGVEAAGFPRLAEMSYDQRMRYLYRWYPLAAVRGESAWQARREVERRWRKLVARCEREPEFRKALESLILLTRDRHPYRGFADDLQKLYDANRSSIRAGKKKGRRPPHDRSQSEPGS